MQLQIKLESRPFVRHLGRKNLDLFLENLNILLSSTEMNNIDLNNLVTVLSNFTNKYFPKQRISRKQYKLSKTPHIGPEILASIKQRNKLYATYLKSKCPLQLAIYKKFRNKVTRAKEAAKRACFERLFQSAKPSDKWSHINRLLCKNKPKTANIHAIKSDEKLITEPLKVCNELNKHFVQIGEKLSSKIPDTTNHREMHKLFYHRL